MNPYIQRGSIWTYIPLVTLNTVQFNYPNEDTNGIATFILLDDLPELLFTILHGIESVEKKILSQRIYPDALTSIAMKMDALIASGKLPIFELDTRMRIHADTPLHDSDSLIVRLHDIKEICQENGVQVSLDPIPVQIAEDDLNLKRFEYELDDEEAPNVPEWTFSQPGEDADLPVEYPSQTIKRINSILRKDIDKRPLMPRERHNLLRIIATLCIEAKINYAHHAAAGQKLEGTAIINGIAVGATTIEKSIKLATRFIGEIPKDQKN